MASTGVLGKGLTFKKGSVAIAQIKEMGDFGESSNDIEVTTHDTSGNFAEYIAGLKEGGEIPITCVYSKTDTSGQIQAITDCQNGTRSTYTITFAQGTGAGSTWSALMHPKSYKIKAPIKAEVTIAFVFKIDGQPTYAAGT
jgi:predicted secreted protein